MSVVREGGCACGAVRYRLTSDPLFTHCCHCLNCQRQTGSAFVINLLIEADRVEVLAGAPEPVDVPRDDGSTQRIFRCPTSRRAWFLTSTSTRGPSCRGSRFPTRRRPSTSTTTRRACGRRRASSGSRRSAIRRAPAPEPVPLAALQVLDEVSRLPFVQAELEATVVVGDHVAQRAVAAVVVEATLRPR